MTAPGAPGPVVPRPASAFRSLRGRRVVVGVPGLGWRGDLRADDPVVHGDRTYVPVLTEQDFYRAELEQLEAFAPLVPVERVWVEQTAEPSDRADWAGARDGTGETLSWDRAGETGAALDAPPGRGPVPVRLAPTVIGRRVVQAVPDGYVRDQRAVTEIYHNAHGTDCVRVCAEAGWYRWGSSGTMPSTVEIPANRLWVE